MLRKENRWRVADKLKLNGLYTTHSLTCAVGSVPLGRAYPAGLGQNALDRRVASIKQPGDLMQSLALPPTFPDERRWLAE